MATMPELLPDPDLSVNDALSRYFERGLKYTEIQQMLEIYHDVKISISALKKRRQRIGLRRRRGEPEHSRNEIRHAIQVRLPDIPWTAGYRNMADRLKQDGYDVRRRMVLELMKEIDPEGVDRRRRRRLRRKIYRSPGPDFCWHIDGYDKLKPYGFPIHGCIDGYSRRIMWLEVDPSNNDPSAVARYYVQCVERTGACPTLMSSDPGTENGTIAALHCWFRDTGDATDEHRGENSHRYVKSTSNQRIEAWWCLLRRNSMEWWIDFFKDLSSQGLYNKDNRLHVMSMRYCFIPVLKKELQLVADRWNNHYICDTPNARCPPGRPNVIHSLGESWAQPVSQEQITFAYRQTTPQTRSGDSDFEEYAARIALDLGWNEAETWREALDQFRNLSAIAERV